MSHLTCDQKLLAAVGRLLAAGDYAVLGVVLAAVFSKIWTDYVTSSSALRRIAAAPTPPVSGLRSLLSSSSGEDRGDADEVLVVVRGRVKTSSAVDSHVNGGDSKCLTARGTGESAVAALDTQTYLYNNQMGLFGSRCHIDSLIPKSLKEPRSCSFRSVPFVIVEDGDSGYVHVNLDGSTHQLPLTTVSHQLHPVMASPYTMLQAFFGVRYPVGLLDEEKILPVGKNITAIGICKLRDGVLEIKACQELPYFLSDLTKDEIIDKLTSTSTILFWSGLFIGTVSIGVLCYAIIRNWRKWKERRQRIERQNLMQVELSDEELGDAELHDGQLCVVCLTLRRIFAFVPCGHLACCRRCALSLERVSSPKCPICRRRIRSSIRIYDDRADAQAAPSRS